MSFHTEELPGIVFEKYPEKNLLIADILLHNGFTAYVIIDDNDSKLSGKYRVQVFDPDGKAIKLYESQDTYEIRGLNAKGVRKVLSDIEDFQEKTLWNQINYFLEKYGRKLF
jgi:hypothetical protein